MRLISIFLLILLFLTACAPPASTITITPPRQVMVSPQAAQTTLGKCVDARAPTPDPDEPSLFPKVSKSEHILGNIDSHVTILVYSDFQCVSCAQTAELLKSLVEKYPQDIRVVFRHFPLESIHDKAAISAQAAEAAHIQGKFWEMHDLIFEKQKEWLNLDIAGFTLWLIQESKTIGLNEEQFETDLTSPQIAGIIQTAWKNGQAINLPGVPLILINEEIIKWQDNLLDQLENYVNLAILFQNQFDSCPPVVINPAKNYVATLKTSKGEIRIKLFADRAPNTVNNFIFLAKSGWYDNIPFHRVVTGVMVQTGDPSGTGFGGPGYFIPSEKNNYLFDRAGMVGMINSGPDTNGSQFLITLSPLKEFNNQYPIFGEVISGLDVLSNLNPNDPILSTNQQTMDMLISVEIEEN